MPSLKSVKGIEFVFTFGILLIASTTIKLAKGKAKVVDRNSGAKLKVTFFWPFYGDYWIIDLGKDYEYAVVGTPNRKYLWVLSRTLQMDDKPFSN